MYIVYGRFVDLWKNEICIFWFDLVICFVFFFLKVEKIEFLNLRLIVKKFGIDWLEKKVIILKNLLDI